MNRKQKKGKDDRVFKNNKSKEEHSKRFLKKNKRSEVQERPATDVQAQFSGRI